MRAPRTTLPADLHGLPGRVGSVGSPRRRGPAAALGALLAVALAAPLAADDSTFFTDNVPPNVVLLIDTSYSMREIMYHPDFDSADSTCALFGYVAPDAGGPTGGSGDLVDDEGRGTHYNCDSNTDHCRFELDENSHGDFVHTHDVTCPDDSTRESGYYVREFCGNERKLYVDGRTRCDGWAQTWYSEWYAEWLFSDAADGYWVDTDGNDENTSSDVNMLDAHENGVDFLTGDTFALYKRSRLTAARQIAKEVIYQTNSNCGFGNEDGCTNFSDRVRFGTAEFRGSHGGFVTAAVEDYSVNKDDVDAALDAMRPDDSTPLAESLFQIYTYFMSRDSSELPLGQDGSTYFPEYEYQESNGNNDPADAPGDPLECPDGSNTCPCQKHFVILISDGDPFNDHFTTSDDETEGFDDFDELIGETYLTGDVQPETGLLSNGTRYLDDIAYFMNTNDFRPDDNDQEGVQTIDVYTVGFNLDSATIGGALLDNTAAVANGQSFFGTQSDEIRDALVESISEIIEKTQSFTAATVPASRTTDGNNFYSTFFVPSSDSPFWEGHLKNFKFDLNGDILTADDKCAIGESPTDPPCPTSGLLRTTADAVWDAADGVPAPVDRELYTGDGATSFGASPTRWFQESGGVVTTTLNYFDLGLDTAPGADLTQDPYNLTNPATALQLGDLASKLISNAAGCLFGGYLGVNCSPRTNSDGVVSLLGDIFHSNPVVVGSPNARINDPTYVAFSEDYRTRDRVIYAGSNDGWLHGFLAGEWQTTGGSPPAPLIPPRHDRGTGEEIFGFMPSETREKYWELPISMNAGSRDFFGPDGTAVAADVWMYRQISSGALSSVLSTPISTTKQKEQWRTVLVGGLREGGRSYYALDVTDPSATAYPGYLWEFPCDDCGSAVNPGSATAIGALGSRSPGDMLADTWSDPVITRVRVAVDGEAGGHDRWVAVVGGGYSPCGDPNTAVYWEQAGGERCDASNADSVRGRAIFMIDITTGELLAAKTFTPSDVSMNGGQVGYDEFEYAFPSQPAVFDVDFDGYADVIYIGDLGGRMWKWVVRDIGDDPINNTAGDKSLGQPDWPFELFFQGAPSGTGGVGDHFQSFFFPPTATLKGSSLVLVFGAGERADPDAGNVDNDDSNNNHLYVVKDTDPYLLQTPPPATITESDLIDIREVDAGNNSCSDVTNGKGYFITARDREKFVTNSVIFLGSVITGSFLPSDPSAATCDTSGNSFLYRFGLSCGDPEADPSATGEENQRRKSIGGGLPTRPRVSVGDLNSGGSNGGCNNKVVVITSDGGIENDCPGPIPTSGINIRSWRER